MMMMVFQIAYFEGKLKFKRTSADSKVLVLTI